MRSAARERNVDLLATANRAAAIFVRDAGIALSYGPTFLFQLLGTMISAAVTYCIALAAGNGAAGPHANYFEYLAINMAFYRFEATALLSFAQSVRENQLAGTLEMMLATPTSIAVLVLSGSLWAFTLCAIETALFLSVSVAFGLDVRHANVLTVATIVLLTVLCISPLGVLAASATIVFKKSGPVEFLFNNAALLFGGVFLPIERLPAALQWISWLLPISHALGALRAGFAGASLERVAADALWLVGATVVLVPLSLAVFARAVRVARKDGTLASY